MPSIYDVKPKFQALLRPLTDRLARMGVTANQVTVAAAVLSCGAGAAVAFTSGHRIALLAIPAVLFVRMGLNAIDGMLAREHHMKSKLGALLNELGDVVSDSALYLSFAFVAGMPGALVVATVVLAVISEMAGVVAIQIGAQRRYDGPMGKSDRAFVFGLLALLLGLGVQTGGWLTVYLGVVIGLLALTIMNRGRRALKEAA
jgi:CDP-diacylglycerol--glycerol-3-phosphate 3-phosphatidyltransferase